MCRNIRVLHHFEPPSTAEEIHAAALQYVRKVSGLRTPAKADVDEVERAVEAVARATTRLLEKLPARGEARTRENERERARQRWASREARIVAKPKPALTTKHRHVGVERPGSLSFSRPGSPAAARPGAKKPKKQQKKELSAR